MPTETVYGLAADATNGLALAKVFETKGRPRINPLIVHVTCRADAERLVTFNEQAQRLADAFWPGPLTLVLPRRADCPVHDLASAGLSTLAVRVPAHDLARALITASGAPLAAPSANRSGEPSPTRASDVIESLGPAIAVLDGGPCRAGLESTVIGFADGRAVLLRAGALTRTKIEQITGALAEAHDDAARPSSPGRLLRHYAPRARLRLNADDPQADELFLGFGPTPHTGNILNLSAAGDMHEAAANLFAMLREADRRGAEKIAVAPIPETGLGEALNDRLRRAAAAQA
jgi:L-threonylcarbamoyladenylate synthase